jgi:hypothetical protein
MSFATPSFSCFDEMNSFISSDNDIKRALTDATKIASSCPRNSKGDTEDGRVVAKLVVEREPRVDLDELPTKLGLRIHVAHRQ